MVAPVEDEGRKLMLAHLMQPLIRPGHAVRKELTPAIVLDRWRLAGRPDGSMPSHRYRLPRNDLRVSVDAEPGVRQLTLNGAPVARVTRAAEAPGGSRAHLRRGVRHPRTAELSGEVEIGEEAVTMTLIGGVDAGQLGRRLRVTAGTEQWAVAERSALAREVGLWRGDCLGDPVAWMRGSELWWATGARPVDIIVLECVRLRVGPALPRMLRRYSPTAAGDARYSVLSTLARPRP